MEVEVRRPGTFFLPNLGILGKYKGVPLGQTMVGVQIVGKSTNKPKEDTDYSMLPCPWGGMLLSIL